MKATPLQDQERKEEKAADQKICCSGGVDLVGEKQGIGAVTVVKRNGMLVPFQSDRIALAIQLAFRDTHGLGPKEPIPDELQARIELITRRVVDSSLKQAKQGASLTVEGIQDLVEVTLMEMGHHDVARDYIVYRDHHKALRADSPRNLKIQRRDGSSVRFNPMKIASSIERAFRASLKVEGGTPDDIVQHVNVLTNKVVSQAVLGVEEGQLLHVELIQDEIERQLMMEGHYEVAKDYILYRVRHAAERIREEEPLLPEEEASPAKGEEEGRAYRILLPNGEESTLTEAAIFRYMEGMCRGLSPRLSVKKLVELTLANFYDGMRSDEIDRSHIMAAKSLVEREPDYTYVAARLLLDQLYRETIQLPTASPPLHQKLRDYFVQFVQKGIELEQLNPELATFDLHQLADALVMERDRDFAYMGIQTLYDRYFLHHEGRRLETPQIFWMRVAMGLALKEGEEKNKRAIEFYEVLSRFLFVSATPTLFNSGTTHSQLSSCYLLTAGDDLGAIFKMISDNAQLSKWAGGIGDDWTNIRSTGSRIKGTNGLSQGVIPFLKIANDTAIAVNQGGKRKGAICAYLEVWHLDIEDFLELRKNTGDDRRRTHDMNTAAWIPDLFMKRVFENGMWTLFSPCDVPDLHDLYGEAFDRRYCEYEELAASGKVPHKRIEAVHLWRKMLSMLFETGHPWITFKDPSNVRSPQDHVGVIHSSNLCTEILLNTSKDETAVCNLGSLNLARLTTPEGLNQELLASTIRTAIRMLDNVIDINFYPIPEARNANMRHRPVGLGIMGFQDALYIQGISYASHDAVEFADASMEMIAYYAILSSSDLAQERGPYESYRGSKWDRGLLPLDTLKLMMEQRGEKYCRLDFTSRLDWESLRKKIARDGMRNSHTMAIAPTATIALIANTTQSIEPTYSHLFVKSNLSGEFTVTNTYLVEELRALGLWDSEMIDDLKYFEGSLLEIERIPEEVKKRYLTAFEIPFEWLVACASRRAKWIEMGQSFNLYLDKASGKVLDKMLKDSWLSGNKTNYYLRSRSATRVEQSTSDINKRRLQPRWMKNSSPSSRIIVQRNGQEKPATPAVCTLEEGCESCQ